MIRLKDFETIAELTKAVKALSKNVPRFHAARARLSWVIKLGLMRLGADRPAIGALPGIIHRLGKDTCRPDEVAAAMMDLAQAYHNDGNWEKACAMLEEAREQYRLASGVSPAVVADLTQLIDELRSGSRTGEPWEIRPLLGESNLPMSIPECETTTEVFPGTSSRHFIPDRPNPNPVHHSRKKTQRSSHRMRYAQYLAAGYPIATGVIEGACRHLVKDRLERTGMHWVLEGAQAMLDLRSVHLADQWDEFTAFRIRKDLERLYP
ncbi:MAG: tetratricopeptide repeat protein, partial [bacterium]|nr:tetratricopeptide repeat protein [bacterium]